jgi:hypothetical protein
MKHRPVGCVLTHRQEELKLFNTPQFCLDGASGRTLRNSICIPNEVDFRRFGIAKRLEQCWGFKEILFWFKHLCIPQCNCGTRGVDSRRFDTAKRLKQSFGLNKTLFWLQHFKNQNLYRNVTFILTFGSAKPTGVAYEMA